MPASANCDLRYGALCRSCYWRGAWRRATRIVKITNVTTRIAAVPVMVAECKLEMGRSKVNTISVDNRYYSRIDVS